MFPFLVEISGVFPLSWLGFIQLGFFHSVSIARTVCSIMIRCRKTLQNPDRLIAPTSWAYTSRERVASRVVWRNADIWLISVLNFVSEESSYILLDFICILKLVEYQKPEALGFASLTPCRVSTIIVWCRTHVRIQLFCVSYILYESLAWWTPLSILCCWQLCFRQADDGCQNLLYCLCLN